MSYGLLHCVPSGVGCQPLLPGIAPLWWLVVDLIDCGANAEAHQRTRPDQAVHVRARPAARLELSASLRTNRREQPRKQKSAYVHRALITNSNNAHRPPLGKVNGEVAPSRMCTADDVERAGGRPDVCPLDGAR